MESCFIKSFQERGASPTPSALWCFVPASGPLADHARRCACEFCVEERVAWQQMGFIKKCELFTKLKLWGSGRGRSRRGKHVATLLLASLYDLG